MRVCSSKDLNSVSRQLTNKNGSQIYTQVEEEITLSVLRLLQFSLGEPIVTSDTLSVRLSFHFSVRWQLSRWAPITPRSTSLGKVLKRQGLHNFYGTIKRSFFFAKNSHGVGDNPLILQTFGRTKWDFVSELILPIKQSESFIKNHVVKLQKMMGFSGHAIISRIQGPKPDSRVGIYYSFATKKAAPKWRIFGGSPADIRSGFGPRRMDLSWPQWLSQ